MKYKIISYDVWGNPKDGFEVNNAHYTPFEIELSDDWTDKELRKALFSSGYCGRSVLTAKLEIDADYEKCIYINLTNSKVGHKPFCELRLVEA